MNKTSENYYFHKSVKFILIIAQIFGFFPVQGVLSDNVFFLKFSFSSVRVIFSFFMSLVGWFDLLANIRFMIIYGFNIHYLNAAIFNFSNATYFLLFVYVAKMWPQLMLQFTKLEETLFKYGWPENFNMKIKLITGVFFIWELVEHVTVQGNKFIVALHCKDSFEQSVEHYFKNMGFRQDFDIINYSHFHGMILQFVNTCFACCWTYVDLFLITIMYYFKTRFRQIRIQLKLFKDSEVTVLRQWKILRQDYNSLCTICRLCNEKFSDFIILSFFTNIYYMVFHIFRTLNVDYTKLEFAYFVICFGLLVFRTCCLCWFGGLLYEESVAPLNILLSTNSDLYNIEIERFIEDVRCENAVFTGKNFFKVEKCLMLKIANAIVMYELILIQFFGIDATQVSGYSRCD